jgi:hypothetical protein
LLIAGRRPEPPLAGRRRRPGWLVGDLAQVSRALYRFKTNRRVSDLGIHEIGYAAW